uniref:Uncharacterized protein n=1 Tax=Siphoviridae sp. ctJYR23 TaxID=2827837 RepID=A0A8S5SM44_9CAUD|nr:MAG TPA: hypothetical protein [Siphoviridae sp. ctJYR23]
MLFSKCVPLSLTKNFSQKICTFKKLLYLCSVPKYYRAFKSVKY